MFIEQIRSIKNLTAGFFRLHRQNIKEKKSNKENNISRYPTN